MASALEGLLLSAIPVIAFGILTIPIPLNPLDRTKRVGVRARRPLAFAAIPFFLFPFVIAVIFESKTNFLPNHVANFLFFNGRFILPLSYIYEVRSYGMQPILQHSTHAWDIAFWEIISVAYGFLTQKLRVRCAFAIAPICILLVVFAFNFIMWRLGYVLWSLPFRVIR